MLHPIHVSEQEGGTATRSHHRREDRSGLPDVEVMHSPEGGADRLYEDVQNSPGEASPQLRYKLVSQLEARTQLGILTLNTATTGSVNNRSVTLSAGQDESSNVRSTHRSGACTRRR